MANSYDELLELARVCRNQAAVAANKEIAADLRQMADEYLRRADALKRGQPRDGDD